MRIAPLITAVLLLGGCAAAPAAPAVAAKPVQVVNCGRTLHFDRPPSRIVSGWSSNTELVLALGAGDALVGQYNTATGTVAGTWAAAAAEVPVLGTGAPGRERLLAARPDLIWADGEYLFDGKQLPTIADLAKQGTQVLVLSGFCGDDATGAKVRDVDTDLAALGTVLGRPGDAQRLRADIDRRLAAVAGTTAGAVPVPVMFLSSFDGRLYTYEGVYSDMAALAGATNVYAGVLPKGAYYGQVSVEDVAKRHPGTVVYLLAAGETEQAARVGLFAALPTFAGRLVFLPQNDSTNLAGIAGVEKLAAGLRAASTGQ